MADDSRRHQDGVEGKQICRRRRRLRPPSRVAILACASLIAASLTDHQAAAATSAAAAAAAATSAAAAAHPPAPARDAGRWTLGEDSWNYWWSYSGVSGPAYWGLLNLDWFLCDKGARQSPINIDTSALVYDPYLTPLRISGDNNLLSGMLYNDGHAIVFNSSAAAQLAAAKLRQQPGETSGESSMSSRQAAGEERNSSENNSVARRRRRRRKVADGDDDDSLEGFIMEGPEFVRPQKVQMMLMRRSNELSNAINLDLDIERGALEQATGGGGDKLDSTGDGGQQAAGGGNSDEAAGVSAAGELAAGFVQQATYFAGAGLAYAYKLETLQLRFGGPQQAPPAGSEHQINGRPFAAELQLLAYNSHLYRNFHEASWRPGGLLGVAILIDVTAPVAPPSSQQQRPAASAKLPNEHLERLLGQAAGALTYRGHFLPLQQQLNLTALLPETDQFVTYDGSLTQPGCHESVTWLLLNRPLYATKQSLDKLRAILADEQTAPSSSGTLLAGNARPVQALNSRPIRTNIRPVSAAATLAAPDGQPGGPLSCPRLWTRYEYIQPIT